jgi:hypothetical protein
MNVSRIIRADAHQVWDLLIDTRTWHRWGPSVKSVHFPAVFVSAGARGRIQTAVGAWLPFVVTKFEPGTYWTWKVGGVRATGHRLEALPPDACRLTFEVPNWAMPYLLVCWLALGNIAQIVEHT